MRLHECPYHHVAMKIVPAEPRSRCPKCGFMTHRVQFGHCSQCGHLLVIEEPEPHWSCPLCHPVGETREAVS